MRQPQNVKHLKLHKEVEALSLNGIMLSEEYIMICFWLQNLNLELSLDLSHLIWDVACDLSLRGAPSQFTFGCLWVATKE